MYYKIKDEFLSNIAAAIREKLNLQKQLEIQEFSPLIRSIGGETLFEVEGQTTFQVGMVYRGIGKTLLLRSLFLLLQIFFSWKKKWEIIFFVAKFIPQLPANICFLLSFLPPRQSP